MRDPTSASDSYNSHKHFSKKTSQANGMFSEKQILLETRRSASFFISLIQLLEKFIYKYENKSVEEHKTKL